MGFVDGKLCEHFLKNIPVFEREIINSGIILLKLWLEVGMEEQDRRFAARIFDPLRQWKLSPMDLESYGRWFDYSRARDAMLKHTDSKDAPWFIVRSDDKRRGRLNCIAHILKSIPYKKIHRPKVKLPKRSKKGAYNDQASLKGRRFVATPY
jgi:polyphosphate kinase